jgi:3-oxoacyl-[acyl-carrier-protein] synthase II
MADGFPVAITGMGLVTAAGIGVEPNWDRVCSGISCARLDERSRDGEAHVICSVPDFDAGALLGGFAAWQTERFVQLAQVAAREALKDAGWNPHEWDGTRVGVVVGNSLGGTNALERQQENLYQRGQTKVSPLLVPMFMVNMVAGYMAIDMKAQGPSQVVASACTSGTSAIGAGRDLLRSGRCDIIVVGGTESALSPLVMAGLMQMGALTKATEEPETASRPFDSSRDGFVAAEGAGMLVLERLTDARSRQAPVHAVVRGYGSATDAHHPTSLHPDGRGIETALRWALADAGIDPSQVDHVNAHGTSTQQNDLVEGTVLTRVLGSRPSVTSTKGVTGHALAAAGAIEAIYTALTLRHGCAPPTANLEHLDDALNLDVVAKTPRRAPMEVAVSTSLGFGGHNAALVLTRN